MTVIALLQNAPAETSGGATDWLVKIQELALQYAPRLVMALGALVVGWIAVSVAVSFLNKALGRSKIDSTLSGFLCNIVRAGLLTLVVLMAMQTLGIQTASFVAILGAAGFAIGFALKDSLGNFASGVMIMIFRPFKAGDFVDAGGTSGSVVEVGVFATVIKTGDNKKVIVSNTSITGNNITNYSAFPTRRIDMVFGIGYDDDIDKARSILQRVLSEDERILAEPAPVIALSELGESSVNFVCRPWVKTSDYWPVRWAVQERVKKAFDAEGVSIPFPQRDVHLHQLGATPAEAV